MSDENDDLWLFRSYADETDVEAVSEVIRRGTWWAKGDEIEQFEARMADRAACDHGIAFNSGTSAAYAILLSLNVSGGEVIVPSHTFAATANVVVAAGAEPVFADIEEDSLALDPTDVRAKVNETTRAIMPIHFAGDVCAGIRELCGIAESHDIPLVEDAAHSPGGTLEGEPVGSFGTAAIFSFCFNKVLTTGEGGMVVTDDRGLRRELELIRSHGRDADRVYRRWGFNLRMPTMCGALGLSQEQKLDEMIAKRREMAAQLNDRLRDVPGVSVPERPSERDPVYQLYNITLEDPAVRPALREALDEQGIPTRVTYEPVHLNKYYRTEWGCAEGDLPRTERLSERILTLPFHLYLEDEDFDRMATAIEAFFGEG